MTQEEEEQFLLGCQETKEMKIERLKANLQSTDYLAIKFFERYLTKGEFAPIKQQRQSWRYEINELMMRV